MKKTRTCYLATYLPVKKVFNDNILCLSNRKPKTPYLKIKIEILEYNKLYINERNIDKNKK